MWRSYKNTILILKVLSVWLISPKLTAQSTADWIVDGQQYFAIKVLQSGIIRIPVDTLVRAGIPIGSFSARNIQVFYRGKEIPTYFRGEENENPEYLQFLGSKNDGWFDTGLYANPLKQANPFYSMFNDTATYFLTWNNNTNNLRYQLPTIEGSSILQTEGRRKSIYFSPDRFYYDEIGPFFNATEGWFSLPEITLGNTTTRTIPLDGKAPNGTIYVDITVCGVNNEPAPMGNNHHLRVSLGATQLLDTIFRGREIIKKRFAIDASMVSNFITLSFSSVNDLGVSSDRMAIASITADYPATFQISPANYYQFTLEPSNQNRRILFQGLSSQTPPIVYAPLPRWRFTPVYTAQGWQITIPPTENIVELHVSTAPTIISKTDIKRASMLMDRYPSDFIMITHPSLMGVCQPYAQYRNALLVNIETLYNRYAYGIWHHPLAIRYFLQDYIRGGYGTPTYLFLVGKGINQASLRTTPTLATQNLVPVAGMPPSDMMLTTRIVNYTDIPEIVVGRLGAINPSDVTYYLSKVIENEQRQPSLGSKNILLFGGGNNATEQTTFANYLRNYQNILTDTLLGGFATLFLKNSSAPMVTSQSDSVRSILEQGPLALTFFGHGWSGGFDQNIDEPVNFNNQGKNPLIIANSCYSGNIFNAGQTTISEKWVLIPQKGALAFLASTNLGYPSFLDRYTREFYRNLTQHYYGQSYGKAILEAVKTLMQTIPSNYTTSTCLEFLLHGDPAAKPVVGLKPDPALLQNSLSIQPGTISTAIDSFAVRVIVSNPGMAQNQPLTIYAEHKMPTGKTQEKSTIIPRVYYKDTIFIYFPIDRLNAPGINRITVTLDYLHQIDELNENNNTQTITFPIQSTEIYPVFPLPFSLRYNFPSKLKASTGNPFQPEEIYIFQLDTTPSFTSPATQTGYVRSMGGVIEWQPSNGNLGNKNYYWRVAINKTTPEQIEWQSSTFSVKNAQGGWIQEGKHHFESNSYQFIEIDYLGRWSFSISPKMIQCINYGSYVGLASNSIRFSIDNLSDYGACGGMASIVLVVVDSLTLQPWMSDRANYGQADYPVCPPRTRPNYYFTFPANETGRQNLRNFLQNNIPDGFYILAYSVGNAQFETWTNNDYAAFENLGASQIRTIPNNYPYIFFTRKGFPTQTVEVVGQHANDVISFQRELLSNFTFGRMTSTWIGPAKSWSKLTWRPNPDQITNTDSLWLNLYGKNKSGVDTLLGRWNYPDTVIDLAWANPLKHTHLQTEYYTYDAIQKTPVELKSWSIEFEPYAELAINPAAEFRFHAYEINEGDTLKLSLAFSNVSDLKSDSYEIRYSVQNTLGNTIAEITTQLDTLPAQTSKTQDIHFSTRNLSGNYKILVKANYPELKGQTIPENLYFNNLGVLPFKVKTDNTQPLLTVLFDGRHIMNKEIVSSHPTILIQLQDNNLYLPLNDTSAMEIWLTYPGSQNSQRIWLTNEIQANTMIWYPATLGQNTCKVIWQPTFTTDGIYELTVKGRDITGNTAGTTPYTIQFEVINKTTITRLLNYPNPFSTSTRFAFTLTGSKVPDDLRIQIYTVTGKCVREITLEELGPIRIGNNLTQFAWDGTDQFGDRLANGVYFYRVVTKIDGQTIEHRSSSIDKFFSKEFGKMYLMK